MEATAAFLGWTLLIVIMGCFGSALAVGTFMGLKLAWHEFLKTQMRYSYLNQANQEIKVLEAQIIKMKE